jgi:hypothetical protein
MAERLYEDSDPAYVTKEERKKSVGPSIFRKGPHWSGSNWADYVAKSAARTVLDRYIYRAVVQANKGKVRVDASMICDQLQEEGKAVPVLMVLAPRGNRHDLVSRRIRYMVWLGVLVNSQKFGTLSIEHVSVEVMSELHRNRTDYRARSVNKREKAAKKMANKRADGLQGKSAATFSPVYHYPTPGPATPMSSPSGPVRTVGDGPGDV